MVHQKRSTKRVRSHDSMSVKDFWITAPRDDAMPPLEQAKLWGLRHAMQALGEETDCFQWFSEQVTVGNDGEHNPSRQAVEKFFQRVDANPQWYPGYKGPNVGRPIELTAQKRKIIARSQMRLKRSKSNPGEPSYAAALAAEPEATLNPTTGKPFSRPKINEVFPK